MADFYPSRLIQTFLSLHVLAYNIKRVIAIIGVGPLLQAIRA
jgi:transposase